MKFLFIAAERLVCFPDVNTVQTSDSVPQNTAALQVIILGVLLLKAE